LTQIHIKDTLLYAICFVDFDENLFFEYIFIQRIYFLKKM